MPGQTFPKSNKLDVLKAKWIVSDSRYHVQYNKNIKDVQINGDEPSDPLYYKVSDEVTTANGNSYSLDKAVFIGWVKKADYDSN